MPMADGQSCTGNPQLTIVTAELKEHQKKREEKKWKKTEENGQLAYTYPAIACWVQILVRFGLQYPVSEIFRLYVYLMC